MMGVKGESVTEIYKFEPGKIVGFRSLEGDPLNARGTYEVTSESEGARLTTTFTVDPKGFMKLIIPFMAPRLKRDIATGLRNTKKYLENQ